MVRTRHAGRLLYWRSQVIMCLFFVFIYCCCQAMSVYVTPASETVILVLVDAQFTCFYRSINGSRCHQSWYLAVHELSHLSYHDPDAHAINLFRPSRCALQSWVRCGGGTRGAKGASTCLRMALERCPPLPLHSRCP